MHMLRQGCSLSMLHRCCKKLHGDVGLHGLSMPNIMCLPFYLKPRGIKTKPIENQSPMMWLRYFPKYLNHWLAGQPPHP